MLLSLAWLSPQLFAAEQGETERLVRRITPPISVIKEDIGKKDRWYFDSYYEPSLIIQGNRTGRWSELTNTFGYIHQNVHGYFNVSELDRLGNNDYTANFGSYLTFKDAYAHIETGFGWDIDYIYDFQAIAEYGHKLIKNIFWQMGYNAGWTEGPSNIRSLTSVMSLFAFIRDQKIFRLKYVLYLLFLSLIEMFAYRWITSFARLRGMMMALRGYKGHDQYVRQKRAWAS